MTFFRILWQSLQQLGRQAWIWAATFVVFVLAFASINTLLGANILANQLLSEARQRIDVSVTFRADTPPALVEQAKTYLLGMPIVESVQAVSADRALELFRQRYQYQEDVLRALEEVGRNPLGAKLVVRAKTLGDYPAVVQVLRSPVYQPWIQAQSATDHAAAIAELESIRRAVRLTGSLLLVLFTCAALLLAFNAVRLAIFAQREEIVVMRLVGATQARIRWPYVLSVLWVVKVSWIATLVTSMAMYAWLLPQASGWFQSGLIALRSGFFAVWPIFLVQLAVGALLSMLVAWIAAGKYIKR